MTSTNHEDNCPIKSIFTFINSTFVSQGLTLSGCEQESSNAELASCVKEKDGNSAKAIYVASDTAGSLFTGAPDGGMVLIAGEYGWRGF